MVGMPIHAQRPRQRQRQLQWHRAAVAAAILLSLFVLPPSVQGYGASGGMQGTGSALGGVLTSRDSDKLTPAHTTRTIPTSHTELSCAGSRVPPPSALRFCGPVVSWRAAAVYAHINYTVRGSLEWLRWMGQLLNRVERRTDLLAVPFLRLFPEQINQPPPLPSHENTAGLPSRGALLRCGPGSHRQQAVRRSGVRPQGSVGALVRTLIRGTVFLLPPSS